MASTEDLPRWSVADVHESLDARSFTDGMERLGADVTRLTGLFDTNDIRKLDPRSATAADGVVADEVIAAYNGLADSMGLLEAYVYALVSTNSRDERAQAVLSEISDLEGRFSPLMARLADWVASLGADSLGSVSE